jgi:hypothetical protein
MEMHYTHMAKEISVIPPQNLLLDASKMNPYTIGGVDVESDSNKELSKTNTIFFYTYETGYSLVFYKKAKLGSKNILELPIENISSSEVISEKKRIGKKWFCILKTTGETIKIRAQEQQVQSLNTSIQYELQKPTIFSQSKEISFTTGGGTKTLQIRQNSPIAQEGEESIFSITQPAGGYIVTNYRVLDYFVEPDSDSSNRSKSLTHDMYEDVIASNVERKTETNTVGGTNSRSSMWNLVQNSVDISYNEDIHHSSSVETEIGNIEFLNEGKQVMIWEQFTDPTSVVQKIKSAKSHFKTVDANTPSSGGDDPIKALKMRFVKGEITKDEFEEMKSMIE